MKTFKKIIQEVAQPSSEDEINFKEKHVIDHILDPNSEEDQFTADHIAKFRNRSDYGRGEDAAVYEGVTLARRDLPGQEDDDLDGDYDDDMIDAQLRYRRHSQIKNKIIDENTLSPTQLKKREEIVLAMKRNSADLKKRYGKDWEGVMYAIATKQAMNESLDPVGKEDADINNDGKVDKTDAFLRARRRAIAKKLQKESLMDVLQPIGGEYGDEEKSHVAYKKKNKTEPEVHGEPIEAKEDVSLSKPKTGLKIYAGKTKKSQLAEMIFEDKTTALVEQAEVDIINNLLETLDTTNKKKAYSIAYSSRRGFNEMLNFARKVL